MNEDIYEFVEWLRINYQNSALEFDNYWQKVVPGEFHLNLEGSYTTAELLDIWRNNTKN